MTWDYIAGFVDGEGSIVKRQKTYYLLISQTNKEILNRIREFVGCGYVFPLTKRKAHWKDAWLYSAGGTRETHYILSHVAEKLIVKKEQARVAIARLEIRMKEVQNRQALREDRKKKAMDLRKKGWSYRKIGRELDTDFGYIRRLILSK